MRFWFGLTSSLWGGILYLLRQEAARALERRIFFYRIKLCQRRRADCMGFVRLFGFRRNLHEDFVF